MIKKPPSLQSERAASAQERRDPASSRQQLRESEAVVSSAVDVVIVVLQDLQRQAADSDSDEFGLAQAWLVLIQHFSQLMCKYAKTKANVRILMHRTASTAVDTAESLLIA